MQITQPQRRLSQRQTFLNTLQLPPMEIFPFASTSPLTICILASFFPAATENAKKTFNKLPVDTYLNIFYQISFPRATQIKSYSGNWRTGNSSPEHWKNRIGVSRFEYLTLLLLLNVFVKIGKINFGWRHLLNSYKTFRS